MPHLTIEYSRNLAGFPEAQVLAALNQTITDSPEVADEADLKSRCVVHDSYAIGTAPAQRAFVHAQLRLLSGLLRTHRHRAAPPHAAAHRNAGAAECGNRGHGPALLHQGTLVVFR